MGYSSKNIQLYDSDIGKKVFTIKEEKTIVIEWEVKAKDENEAFEKWLKCPKDETMEDHKVRDNGDDVICTYAKEYSELTEGMREKGTIQREDPEDEDSDLEVA
tara:strand:+ start:227 stop:538 length:312 start_codon:yes stop_codon:yes gene_type:complete